MGIDATVTSSQIVAAVTEGGVSVDVAGGTVAVDVSGGVGPTGPQGPSGASALPAGTEGYVLTYVSGSWVAAAPSGAVLSVAGKTGTVTLATADITGLDTALSAKAPLASPTFTGTVSGITAAMVGLGNVANVDARARSSHTGTQLAATISDFASAVAAASPEEVIEATTVAGFPATGDTSSLYIATDTSRFYRWTGSVYVEVGPVATYPATHTHTASQITGGTATTFLRGDGTFAAVGPQLVLSAHTQANSISANANTNLRYSTAITDADSAYSTTTGKYTVPTGKSGIYAVYIGFVADGGTTGSTIADLKIFGTTLGEVSINGSATYATVDGTLRFAGMVFVSLTAGEDVNLRSYATAALTANNQSTTFNVFKLFRM